MKHSFIYSDIMNAMGMFVPKSEFELINENQLFCQFIGEKKTISKNTAIGYYPGCFAAFHEGHLSVVREALSELKKISNDYLLVVSPANSDYTAEKYGRDSVYASNYYRFNRIFQFLKNEFPNEAIVIDLNPMLNMRCDFNFTDLIKSFIELSGVKFDELVNVPRMVVGKDRQNFAALEEFTDKLKFICVEDTTSQSSTNIITRHPIKFKKKKLILRCESHAESQHFKAFFGKQYEDIQCLYLDDELDAARNLIKNNKIDFTICKEYSGLLPYVKLSRDFAHALDTPTKFKHAAADFDGKVILDSDVYSGSTKNYIEALGGKVISVLDMTGKTDEYEIIDFADFKKPDYCYPFVDVAERCSMMPFDFDTHKLYDIFKLTIPKNSY